MVSIARPKALTAWRAKQLAPLALEETINAAQGSVREEAAPRCAHQTAQVERVVPMAAAGHAALAPRARLARRRGLVSRKVALPPVMAWHADQMAVVGPAAFVGLVSLVARGTARHRAAVLV